MHYEFERKFLLKNDHWRAQVSKTSSISQGYLTTTERASTRVRIQGAQANLNIKAAKMGIAREEFEYEIPLAEARYLLDYLCEPPILDKKRHWLKVPTTEGDQIWEIDEFLGENQGLVVAEIELASIDANFVRPAWLGEEVTHLRRYYNVSLLSHPYQQWSAAERSAN